MLPSGLKHMLNKNKNKLQNVGSGGQLKGWQSKWKHVINTLCWDRYMYHWDDFAKELSFDIFISSEIASSNLVSFVHISSLVFGARCNWLKRTVWLTCIQGLTYSVEINQRSCRGHAGVMRRSCTLQEATSRGWGGRCQHADENPQHNIYIHRKRRKKERERDRTRLIERKMERKRWTIKDRLREI